MSHSISCKYRLTWLLWDCCTWKCLTPAVAQLIHLPYTWVRSDQYCLSASLLFLPNKPIPRVCEQLETQWCPLLCRHNWDTSVLAAGSLGKLGLLQGNAAIIGHHWQIFSPEFSKRFFFYFSTQQFCLNENKMVPENFLQQQKCWK